MRRRQFLATATVGTPLLAGCIGDDTGDPPGGGAGPTTVSMVNTTFRPLTVEVATGATVEWVNDDGFHHDITAAQFTEAAEPWAFSATLDGGASTSFTFDATGVFQYECTIHGERQMCGAVLVGGASMNDQLPCADRGGY